MNRDCAKRNYSLCLELQNGKANTNHNSNNPEDPSCLIESEWGGV